MTNYQASLDKFLVALRSSGIPLREVYLYGSLVKNEQHAWSDVDLGVVTQPFARDSIEETIKLQNLAHRIDPALSPISLHEEDLNNPYDSLSQTIKLEGKPLLNSIPK